VWDSFEQISNKDLHHKLNLLWHLPLSNIIDDIIRHPPLFNPVWKRFLDPHLFSRPPTYKKNLIPPPPFWQFDQCIDVCIFFPSGLNESLPREGSATPNRILFHFFWSPVCSFINRRDLKSCCIMFPHRFFCDKFCRHRLQRPLASAAVIILFMQFSSSLLTTWPIYRNISIWPLVFWQ